MYRILAAMAVTLFGGAALAQSAEAPRTILVLDGSGSMWGQIDGVAKITIAQQVVGQLLGALPEEQELGLTVYGHRRKGDCADIETLVAPGAGTRAGIAEAVNAISPKGKTPMTAAITAAAEALRFTEEKATVILVSDGIETCEPDPCAAAAALEAAGVDFTAHVVGFDVTDPEALAQMQCLADNTGGVFATAANAEELTAALTTVAAAPPLAPEPATVPITLTARLGTEDGPLIGDPVLWSLSDTAANPLTLDLAEGSYEVTATWTLQDVTEATQFIVQDTPREIAVVFEAPAPEASVTGPASAPLGSTIEVGWTGPDGDRDYIGVGPAGGKPYVNYSYTEAGSPLTLQMPPEAGAYELRYYTADGEVIAAAAIDILPVVAELVVPGTAPLGSTVEIGWTGPDYDRDYIAIGKPGEATYVNYTYTDAGTPLSLQMPPEEGTYEIRYHLGQGGVVLATRPIEVAAVGVTLEAPGTAVVGETISVAWTGPGEARDFVSVGEPGKKTYVNYTYAENGTPLPLDMPPRPGLYEIRYQLGQGSEVLATRPIEVTAAPVTIEAPGTALAGEPVAVTWTGPAYDRDFISVGEPGKKTYVNYTYVGEGSPLILQMPPDPGSYEIRYQLRQGSEVLATRMVEIAAHDITLIAPASGKAGGMVEIGHNGPDYPRDFIAVSLPDDRGYERYTYTEAGNPLQLKLPDTPGRYEIRYFLGQENTILARVPIDVTE